MPEDRKPHDAHLPAQKGNAAAFLAEIAGPMVLAQRGGWTDSGWRG